MLWMFPAAKEEIRWKISTRSTGTGTITARESLKKPQIVAANKIDMIDEEDPEDTGISKRMWKKQGYKVFPMSAPINQGVQEVLAAAANKLQQVLAQNHRKRTIMNSSILKRMKMIRIIERLLFPTMEILLFCMGNSCLRSSIPPTLLISGRSDICTSTLRRAVRSIK